MIGLASRFLIPDVVKAFDLLTGAAALKVNVGKTVFVPLYPTTKFQVRRDIRTDKYIDRTSEKSTANRNKVEVSGPQQNMEILFSPKLYFQNFIFRLFLYLA